MGGNPPALAAPEAATQEEPWQEADGSASGIDGDPVRAEERHPLGDAAPGVGMRQRDELLALSARVAASRVWQRIHKMLLCRLRGSNKIDFRRAVIDSACVRATLGGARRGRTRRIAGRKGPNIMSSLKLRGFPLRSMSRKQTATT